MSGANGATEFTDVVETLDELRARGRRATSPVDIDTLPQALLAREPVVGVEDMDAVFRAIGCLSDDLKTALVLRDVETELVGECLSDWTTLEQFAIRLIDWFEDSTGYWLERRTGAR